MWRAWVGPQPALALPPLRRSALQSLGVLDRRLPPGGGSDQARGIGRGRVAPAALHAQHRHLQCPRCTTRRTYLLLQLPKRAHSGRAPRAAALRPALSSSMMPRGGVQGLGGDGLEIGEVVVPAVVLAMQMWPGAGCLAQLIEQAPHLESPGSPSAILHPQESPPDAERQRLTMAQPH